MEYTYHCLFEQSGTFRDRLRAYGFEAADYDICDDFGKTDNVVDLFKVIDEAFDKGVSPFGFGPDDFVFAFYPCTRFSTMFKMCLLGNNSAYLKKGAKGTQTLLRSIKLHGELHDFYVRLCKLCFMALKYGFPLVVENPAHDNYLRHYFPFDPALVIENRRDMGDYFVKPTMFFFFNCEPKYNFIFEPGFRFPQKRVDRECGITRSLISPYFVDRFLREYIFEPALALKSVNVSIEEMQKFVEVKQDVKAL